MAWIKLRTDLLNDPAVYKMASALKQDRYAIVGRLAAFWGWADQHAVDGVVDGASSQVVDDVVSLPGFADALCAVKWLRIEADCVVIPNHDRHNGANAKERSLKSERQAKWRATKAPEKPSKPVDGPVDGDASTREEERRGDKNPSGSSARPKRATASKRVPGDFVVTPEMQEWAQANAPAVNWRTETDKFRDWEFQHARSDWPACWRTWLRKAQERAGQGSGGKPANDDWTRNAA